MNSKTGSHRRCHRRLRVHYVMEAAAASVAQVCSAAGGSKGAAGCPVPSCFPRDAEVVGSAAMVKRT